MTPMFWKIIKGYAPDGQTEIVSNVNKTDLKNKRLRKSVAVIWRMKSVFLNWQRFPFRKRNNIFSSMIQFWFSVDGPLLTFFLVRWISISSLTADEDRVTLKVSTNFFDYFYFYLNKSCTKNILNYYCSVSIQKPF